MRLVFMPSLWSRLPAANRRDVFESLNDGHGEHPRPATARKYELHPPAMPNRLLNASMLVLVVIGVCNSLSRLQVADHVKE
jgi:hypothetical protein